MSVSDEASGGLVGSHLFGDYFRFLLGVSAVFLLGTSATVRPKSRNTKPGVTAATWQDSISPSPPGAHEGTSTRLPAADWPDPS